MTDKEYKINKLKDILKYQIEARGGKVDPKDDFYGFIKDILGWIKYCNESSRSDK